MDNIMEFPTSNLFKLLVLLLCISKCFSFEPEAALKVDTQRTKRVLSMFQVISFPNEVCTATSRNGTCYTAEECSAKNGQNSGTCAQGFGVCCVFTLSCGGQSSDNVTYLVQSTITSSPVSGDGSCEYKICKASNDICRIRFDFNTLNLVGPETGKTQAEDAPTTAGTAIGDCTTDAMFITSPGNLGSPVICGFNDGQHMILDASADCHKIVFDIGGGSSTNREWDIKVTQYSCGSQLGGPDGCLQYFTGTSGTVSSFNFPTTSSTVSSTVTHLSNQLYTMCWRQERGYCAVCFITAITPTTDMRASQTSFGLSNAAIAAQGETGTACISDYLEIPGGVASTVAVGTHPVTAIDRFCGRYLGDSDGATASASVCTHSRPFHILFRTDADEDTFGGKEVPDAGPPAVFANEQAAIGESPGGIIGFSLSWVQKGC